MIKGKKGAGLIQGLLVLGGLALLVFFLIWIFGGFEGGTPVFEQVSTQTPTEILMDKWNVAENSATGRLTSLFGGLLGLVVGDIPVGAGSSLSALIVVLAIWVIFFLTMTDLVKLFSVFSETTAWFVGFGIAVIIANVGVVSTYTSWMIKLFAFFGAAAIFLGLGFSILAFLVVETGFSKLMPWVMRRKAAQQAIKSKETTGTVLESIRHYREVGEELKK